MKKHFPQTNLSWKFTLVSLPSGVSQKTNKKVKKENILFHLHWKEKVAKAEKETEYLK